ncbi:MAG: cytochrome b/b6 domain-containing protein [Methylocella sp.]
MSGTYAENGQDYSAAAKWLHWIVAAIVITLIPVGVIMADLPEGSLQDWMFFFHESFGVTVLALMVVRLIQRLRGAPPPYPTLTRTERILSIAVHRALYLLLFLAPLLGWLALSAYGLGPAFFGLGKLPALIGKDEPLSKILFQLHGLVGFVIAGVVAIHIAGAFLHGFVKRDGLIFRMLPVSWRG